jgi:hypothetical protein
MPLRQSMRVGSYLMRQKLAGQRERRKVHTNTIFFSTDTPRNADLARVRL